MTDSHEVTLGAVVLPGRAGIYTLMLRDGAIAAIEPWIGGDPRWVGLPGLVNLHAHADRAFAADSFRPASLADAVAAAAKARAAFTAADVQMRATRFFEHSIAHGVTRVRTHTDVDAVVELRSMEGVLSAKRAVADRLDVEIIAFATARNDLAEPDGLRRLEHAIELKADLLGASLNSSAEPKRALDALLTLAERHGLPVDLHIDEHLEPGRQLGEPARGARDPQLHGSRRHRRPVPVALPHAGAGPGQRPGGHDRVRTDRVTRGGRAAVPGRAPQGGHCRKPTTPAVFPGLRRQASFRPPLR